MRTAMAIAVGLIALAACDIATDPATRLAYDIEAAVNRLGNENGASDTIRHATPSKSGECAGPYKVQLDQVGAMIVWCMDAAGARSSWMSASNSPGARRRKDDAT